MFGYWENVGEKELEICDWKCYCLGLKIRKDKKSSLGNLASCNLLPDCYGHVLFAAFLSSSKVLV